MAKSVRVRITASERVTYDQVVTLTPSEWEQLKAMRPKDASEVLGDMLNKHDCDGDGIDKDDFEAFVVNKDNEPVKPSDRYQLT